MSTAVATPRSRSLLPWAAAALVILALITLVANGAERPDVPLDPDNPRPAGSMATVRILRDQGLEVDVVRGREALEAARPGPGDTVVIGIAEQSSVPARDLAMDAADGAGRTVVLAPRPEDSAGLGLDPVAGSTNPLDAACTELDGTRIDPAGLTFTDTSQPSQRCFVSGDAASLVRLDTGGDTWVLGAERVLMNGALTQESHAAVALRLLGQHGRVIWYVPVAEDTPVGSTVEEPSIRDLVPRWVGYVLSLLLFATLATMLWRGRRLGRLVREPLPVLVRAGELTAARGRLYREARDHPRAARALQIGTRRRLAARFGLPPGARPEQLLPHVAAASGRGADQLFDILYTHVPATDAALQQLAASLALIEEEVSGR